MRLYQTPDGKIHGTQADARKVSKKFERVDVPTDKDGLIAYLNARPTSVEEHASVPAPQSASALSEDRTYKNLKAFAPKNAEWAQDLDQVKTYIGSALYDEVRCIQVWTIDRVADLVAKYRLDGGNVKSRY